MGVSAASRAEAAFTLIEVVVVAGIMAVVMGALGVFFLAGATPAVASAARDVVAVFDEARQTAVAFDAASVVFEPAAAGTGYTARVYHGYPNDPRFAAVNGPAFESAVSISETSSPLDAPGFAFTLDTHGTIVAFSHYRVGDTALSRRACPAGGSFTLDLVQSQQTRIVTIPCHISVSGVNPVAIETSPPALVFSPAPAGSCPAGANCTLGAIAPPPASCPPGTQPDASLPGVCDPPGALSVSPASLLFVTASAAGQAIEVHESYYSGPFSVVSNNCGAAISMTGGGTGTDAQFTVAPNVPARCSFSVSDNHGGLQAVQVVTYGALTVAPNALYFGAPGDPPQSTIAHEDFYSGVITADTTTAGPQYGGCSGAASLDAPFRSTDAAWNAGFVISPQANNISRCYITYRDDHGGEAQLSVEIDQPLITCPNGTVVPFGTPCPTSTPFTLFNGITIDGIYGEENQPGSGSVPEYWYPYHTFAQASFQTAIAPTDSAHALNIVVGGGSADLQSSGVNTARCTSQAPGTYAVSTNRLEIYVGTGGPSGGQSTPSGTSFPDATGPFSVGTSFTYFDPAATTGTYNIYLSAPPCAGQGKVWEWAFYFPVMVTQMQ